MWFYVQLKQNLAGFIFTAIRTFANLIAMTGCHLDMVTMATVNSNLFLYIQKRITSKCGFFNQNFLVQI